jgi:hypothetical protein
LLGREAKIQKIHEKLMHYPTTKTISLDEPDSTDEEALTEKRKEVFTVDSHLSKFLTSEPEENEGI